jgi:ubiquinone/menaquinone biosynthesis C-methylase UbiE
MENIKSQLKEYYNKYADYRNRNSKPDWKQEIRQRFIDLLKTNHATTLLEAGAGTGQDSLFFKEMGLDVTTIDLSEKHVELCRQKGPNAFVMDFFLLIFQTTFSTAFILSMPSCMFPEMKSS